ncbi:MAG: hypothetical protein SFV20_11940 [Sphingopyxis sp.]|nr:hypothetical protein [Sphingopyxis sp.]
MHSLTIEAGPLPVSLAEAREWLRLGPNTEDGVVTALIRSAANLCELATGQMLVVREVAEERPVADGWIRLRRQPVRSVVDVTLQPETGLPVVLAREAWEMRAEDDGAVAVRVLEPGAAESVIVRYQAGLAVDAGALPDALKQGMLRMIQHLYAARDGGGEPAVPNIVTALWTPWRRVSL